MARKLSVEYSGAIYHIVSRGDWREPIFSRSDQGAGASENFRPHSLSLLALQGVRNEG